MTPSEPRLHNGQKGAALTVRVVPGSPEDGILAVLKDGTLKIGLRPREMGLANEALLAYLSKIFDAPVDKFEIVAGREGLDKLISVLGVDINTIQERVFAQIR
ncbi:MAG: hypothetical protein Fur0018_01930 [Anaerolineales bacterium]